MNFGYIEGTDDTEETAGNNRGSLRILRKEAGEQAVDAMLNRLGYAPAKPGDEARRDACRRFLADSTRERVERYFAIDPLYLPLFEKNGDESGGDWSLLFGLAHAEHTKERSRVSVMRHLYNRESGPEGSRMNCFPFIRSDASEKSSSFAFLWRVFDRETDRVSGETKGHILFIPY